MTINRTTLLGLPLPVTGTESGAWGDVTNNGLSQYIDTSVAGALSITGTVTLANTLGDASATNLGATTAQYRTLIIPASGPSANIVITAPSSNRTYHVINRNATYTVQIRAGANSGVTLAVNQSATVSYDSVAGDYVLVGGNVVGPASATDNAVVRFDGTTGKLVQNSVVTIADSTGDVAGVGALTMGGNLTLSGGTANGVLYLNGSKVATSGSALTFDGTNFATTGTASATKFIPTGGTATGNGMYLPTSNELAWSNNGSETMRLTSTGLGIGTSSPDSKLSVAGAIKSTGNSSATASANSAVLAYVASSTARLISYGPDTSTPGAIQFVGLSSNAGSGDVRATIDSSGNLGLGVTPSGFAAAQKVLQVLNGSFYADASSAGLQYNSFFNGTNERYIANGHATSYYQASGQHIWRTAPSGTAGNVITFTQALALDANRNLLLNGTSAGASAVGTLAIFNGTAPTGSVTDGIILYAQDVSSSSELKVRDEAGNVTTLSPHNFSLIPEGPSEDMAWAYYSEKGGKRINVDMLKLARMVEKLTGEKLVYES